MDQVTGTTPTFVLSPKSCHTVLDASTMSFLHPCLESHSSTTLATVVLPFLALILIIFPHSAPWLYHPVDKATTLCGKEWNLPSHSEGPPPFPWGPKSLKVSVAWVPSGLNVGDLWSWLLEWRDALVAWGRRVETLRRKKRTMNTSFAMFTTQYWCWARVSLWDSICRRAGIYKQRQGQSWISKFIWWENFMYFQIELTVDNEKKKCQIFFTKNNDDS